jgi:hypothetical protein
MQNEEELLSLCEQYELNSSNMRHLASLLAGNGLPTHVKGWRLLDTVKWIRRETDGSLVQVPHEVRGAGLLSFVPACDFNQLR